MRSLCIAALGVVLGVGLCAQEPAIPTSLSLEEAVRLAEARNPLLVVAREAVGAAAADAAGAARRPNPALTLGSEGFAFSQQDRPPFVDSQELSISIEQDFEPGGRRRLRTEFAQLGLTSSRASAEEALRQLRFDVRRAYMTVVLAEADDEAARATLGDIDKVLALNRARYEQGETSGVELRRLQVERFRFADDVFAGELALKNARCALMALLNVRPLDHLFDTVDELLPPSLAATLMTVPEDVTSAIGVARARRPDAEVARRDLEQAETGLRLQRALRTPVFSVGVGLKRDFGANGFVMNLAVPLPLFSRNGAGIARAGAEQRQAAARVTAVENSVSLDVQQTLNALDVTRRRVDYIEREYVRSARDARDIVLVSYRSGAATLIDYLDAQRALREALRVQNRARFDYRISLFQYDAAVGTPAPALGKELR